MYEFHTEQEETSRTGSNSLQSQRSRFCIEHYAPPVKAEFISATDTHEHNRRSGYVFTGPKSGQLFDLSYSRLVCQKGSLSIVAFCLQRSRRQEESLTDCVDLQPLKDAMQESRMISTWHLADGKHTECWIITWGRNH